MQKPEMTREQAETIVQLLDALGIGADPFEYEDENGKWGVEIPPTSDGFSYVYKYPDGMRVTEDRTAGTMAVTVEQAR